jgi:hypothetical protein
MMRLGVSSRPSPAPRSPLHRGASSTRSARGCPEAGIQDAVARHDTAPIFDWLVTLISLQGISDAVAFDYDARHGGVRYAEIEAALRVEPSCPRLRCHWSFDACGYRKGAGTCAEPDHLGGCPLPRRPLRKGVLNQATYSLFLFIRDVCGGDLVNWIDGRLRVADPGLWAADRRPVIRAALLGPLGHIHGTGPKLWSMILAELLMAGDPSRERWVTAGAAMIAIDTLVHNFLHRTGTLDRLGAEHPYGAGSYAPKGCAEIIETLAERIDARAFNPAFPACFPRFVQHAIWRFCSVGVLNVCNGNRIDDRGRCKNGYCPAFDECDRQPLRAG